jgi:rhamnosyltransferase
MTRMGLKIAAVATAYHPDERLGAVVASAVGACERVIVVDNTPDGAPSAAASLADERVTVLRSGENLGLAGGLNAGVAALPAEAEAVLFLDQDSELPEDLVPALAALLESDGRIGVAAPTPWDPAHDAGYDSVAALRAEVSDRTDVITSGMLVRRRALEQAGGFREEFFVDFVDIDFCLRVRRAGWRIVQDQRLRLPHSLGDRREHRLGPVRLLVVHHPTWRQYWILRGASTLGRENLLHEPVFSVKSAAFAASWLWRTAFFADDRAAQTTAAMRGVVDGLLGRVSRRYLPKGARYVSSR